MCVWWSSNSGSVRNRAETKKQNQVFHLLLQFHDKYSCSSKRYFSVDHSHGPTDKNSVIPRDKALVRLNKCDREYIQNGTSLIYIINEVHQLFLAFYNVMQRHPYCFCCWGTAAGNIIRIFLIKKVFSPLWSHRYWSGWYTLWPVLPESQAEIRGHTKRRGNAPPPPPQLQISVFMQSNRVVDGKDDCGMAGQRVQQGRRVPLFNMCRALMHLALKGNVRRRLDWFELCSAQKHTHD